MNATLLDPSKKIFYWRIRRTF